MSSQSPSVALTFISSRETRRAGRTVASVPRSGCRACSSSRDRFRETKSSQLTSHTREQAHRCILCHQRDGRLDPLDPRTPSAEWSCAGFPPALPSSVASIHPARHPRLTDGWPAQGRTLSLIVRCAWCAASRLVHPTADNQRALAKASAEVQAGRLLSVDWSGKTRA